MFKLVWDLFLARFLRSKICSMMSTLSSTLLNLIYELIVYSLLCPNFSEYICKSCLRNGRHMPIKVFATLLLLLQTTYSK